MNKFELCNGDETYCTNKQINVIMHMKRVLIILANSSGSNGPVHPNSLVRASTLFVHTQYLKLEQASDIERFSDCAFEDPLNAQR